MTNHGGKSVFIASAVIIFGLVIVGAAFPVAFGNVAEAASHQLPSYLAGSISSVFGFVVFLIGRRSVNTAKYVWDPRTVRPATAFSWISMLLAAGFGVGLVFYGMAEPMTHYINLPYGDVPAESEAAARYAIQYSYFNGEFTAGGILRGGFDYCYFQFRKGQAGLVSSVLSSSRSHPRAPTLPVDVFAVVATVMGVATSLGLGVLQMNGGLNAVFEAGEWFWQFVILFVMFCAYMASTWSGWIKALGACLT